MVTPTQWGSEFLVNTTTTGTQTQPNITSLADGRFLVMYEDGSQTGGDTSSWAVRAQIFNANGTKSGAEFLVNTTTSSAQYLPNAAALENGSFVIAFTDDSLTGSDTSGTAVRAQIFNANGTKSGAEFLVNSTTTGIQYSPTITTLANGRFVVAFEDWSATGDDTSSRAIRAQIFNADGTKFGSEFLVNTTTDDQQDAQSITALADGRFVVAFTDYGRTGGDTSQNAIRAQMFNADGTKSGVEFLVNSTTLGSQGSADIAGLTDGRFVVTFVDYSATGGDSSSGAIRAQIFNADGTKSGNEFLVNTTTTDDQSFAAIAALIDGRFVITFVDASATGGDLSGKAIRAQVFNADGTKSGSEFLVNTTTAGDQFRPTITVLEDGRLVIAFEDPSQTGSDTSSIAVRGQIFDPRVAGIDITGTSVADDFIGSKYSDIIKSKGGDDSILGGGGGDSIWGGSGKDTLSGQNGNDVLVGGKQNDILRGGDGKDTLRGGDNNDKLLGDASNDKLFGDKGNDILKGGDGKDQLSGGKQNDKLTGGDGKDRFIFAKKEGKNTITDFEDSVDKIDLSAFNFSSKSQALSKFFEIGNDQNDKIGFKHKNTEIVVKGIDMGDLGGGDIII